VFRHSRSELNSVVEPQVPVRLHRNTAASRNRKFTDSIAAHSQLQLAA
jgi:hypothetical protein